MEMYKPVYSVNGLVQMDHTAALNHYYTSEVQLSRENTKKSVELAIPYVKDILSYINAQDRRFKKDMVCVGSYWQGLKVDRADEFDVSVALDIPEKFMWTQYTPRYIQLNPHNPNEVVRTTVPLPAPETGYTSVKYSNPSTPLWRNSTDFIVDDNLVPLLVRNRFKGLLKQAVRDLEMRGTVGVSRKPTGPAMTIYLKPPGHHMISVDFAPVFQTRLSFRPRHGWPRPNARWPSQEKIQKIKEVGINDTAKKDFDWLESFAECEKELVKEIDKDGGFRKKCHRIMKSLTHDIWCPGAKPVLTSYVLKNVWFWECEEHPYTEEWTNEMLWTRFKDLTTRLLLALRQRHLSVYFYPNVNLMKGKDPEKLDKVISNIERFMADPEHYLRRSS